MEVRVFGDDLGDVMIHDQPVHFIEARFKGEIRDPRGAFAEFALFPEIVMVGFQRHRLAVELFRQPLQQQAGDQTVEVALVGENNLRLGQSEHESQINSIGCARRAGNFCVLESKVTTTKDADADLYERLLTIQNAADLQWPVSNPANAGIRDQFRLNTFPPASTTTTPAAPPTPPPATPHPEIKLKKTPSGLRIRRPLFVWTDQFGMDDRGSARALACGFQRPRWKHRQWWPSARSSTRASNPPAGGG